MVIRLIPGNGSNRFCIGVALALLLPLRLWGAEPSGPVEVRAQVAAYATPADAIAHWQQLLREHAPLVDGLRPCIDELHNASQHLYRLQLQGPAAACDRLAQAGIACLPVLAPEGRCAPPPTLAASSFAAAVVVGPRLQLGAFRHYHSVTEYWHQQRQRHSALLSQLIPCMQVSTPHLRPAPLYRLQLGGLTADTDPAQLCRRFRAAGLDCSVAAAAGPACLTQTDLLAVATPEPPPTPLPGPTPVPPAKAPQPATRDIPPARAPADPLPDAVAEGVSLLPQQLQQQNLVELDFDSPPRTAHALTPHLSYGATLALETQLQEDMDLDGSQDDRRLSSLPELKLALSYTPSGSSLGYVEFKLKKTLFFDHPDNRSSDVTRLDLDQLYLLREEFIPGWSVQLGRQAFTDEREWLFDDELDAVRLFYRYRQLGFELSLSREDLLDRNLLTGEGERDRIDNLLLLGRYAYDADGYVDGYLFLRDNREPRAEDLYFLGLHSQGQLARHLDYWLEAALVRGSKRERDIRGYGVDVGMTWAAKRAWKPALTLGLAFGSGDDHLSDGVDGNFRQTDLQDNNDRFNGVTSFKYYGEVFDPELSNLQILTLGAGLRPAHKFSIDLVYHGYWQHKADDDIRDSSLDLDPDGEHRGLGHELDLIVGFRYLDLSIKGIFGVFDPGAAFADDADQAHFGEFKVEYRF